MGSIELSLRTGQIVEAMYPDGERQAVSQRLAHECGSGLPLWRDTSAEGLERIRFAVLKLSDGHAERLARLLKMANTDWRDLLLEAGFGLSIGAHAKWAVEYLAAHKADK